ncbi:MAG: GLUG motif-containing protein, partial [Candidatus Thermoplasmatota archaeon]|nr:GLUG motif-containing protein [Candidatus Thermoplasmatota archaeon]
METTKILAAFVAFAFLVTAISSAALADLEDGALDKDDRFTAKETGWSLDLGSRETRFGGGDGTQGNPYLIENVWDLQNMSLDRNAHYALANDIDASATVGWNAGEGFVPIGTSANRFTGSLDGRNHTITSLYINRPTTSLVGMFGYVETGAVVKNVGLVNVDIMGPDNTGGLIGSNRGTVDNCHASGSVAGSDAFIGGLVGYNFNTVKRSHATVDIMGYRSVGGLVGRNDGSVSDCYATGAVVVTGYTIGGLVGFNRGTITDSYAMGDCTGTTGVGGLAGYTFLGTISNSYSTGSVTRSSGTETRFGGFLGTNEDGKVINCYSTGGVYESPGVPWAAGNKGFSGSVIVGGTYEMTGNYWDTETSMQTTTAGNATGKTTAQMKQQGNFVGWDFADTWFMAESLSYPLLRDMPNPMSGSGTSGDPYVIYDVWTLQDMNLNLSAHYILAW